MDPAEEIDDALEDLRGARHRDEKLSLLNCIHDRIGAELELGWLEGRIENLIDLIPFETDHEVRNRMFDVVERAFATHLSLAPSLDGLVAELCDSDPALICNVLLLLPRAGDAEYLPLVERYRTHANDFVRRNAEYAWKHMHGAR